MTLGFSPEFVPLIVNGTKIHTIRTGQRWSVGQAICFCTNEFQGELRSFRPDGVVTAVQAIRITAGPGPSVCEVDGRPLPDAELAELARRDGFESPAQLRQFFMDNYELPFVGQLVHWTTARY
ncbi:ASCH domain-containing protein [Hymenobacter sp. ASUV-10]|uniref:ASCH domain-containing protein n=1 Tax=Hymenobacter aranciens TaxID=3063996 RepID=A0ABT9BH09_9BACT|nr:ASCH domain-containing protein [Hymenobacter sp. ASUV-10]MDO7877537.1 ASCH domain-containing protein [Hymenobacter sp. ASUV-10]